MRHSVSLRCRTGSGMLPSSQPLCSLVEPGTMLLIDEPERHLHRSIIEPFLSALFSRRKDCVFVVSTHEIALPVANPKARVLMVRSCRWKGDMASAWDVELLEPNMQTCRKNLNGTSWVHEKEFCLWKATRTVWICRFTTHYFQTFR